jgi:hypothetical protein
MKGEPTTPLLLIDFRLTILPIIAGGAVNPIAALTSISSLKRDDRAEPSACPLERNDDTPRFRQPIVAGANSWNPSPQFVP